MFENAISLCMILVHLSQTFDSMLHHVLFMKQKGELIAFLHT